MECAGLHIRKLVSESLIQYNVLAEHILESQKWHSCEVFSVENLSRKS